MSALPGHGQCRGIGTDQTNARDIDEQRQHNGKHADFWIITNDKQYDTRQQLNDHHRLEDSFCCVAPMQDSVEL